MTKSCRIWLIIGIILLVIAIAVVVSLMIFWEDIAMWGLEKAVGSAEQAILANLPAGIQQGDVEETFKEFRRALGSGLLKDQAKAAGLQKLATSVQGLVGKKDLSASAVRAFLNQLRAVTGQAPLPEADEMIEESFPDSSVVDSLAAATG
jgi:hypothetical protein